MAVFLVAVLYYLVGIGETILHRQRLQDAADAAAFSAAAMHARGMNIIVLMNMVMAALLAILVVLKLVELLCIAGIAIAVGLSFFTFGASMAAVPPLKAGRDTMSTLFQQLKPPIYTALQGLHTAASDEQFGIKRAIPLASQARVMTKLQHEYSPTTTALVTFPVLDTLPIADDSFERLCEKAGQYAGSAVMLPFRAPPLHVIPRVVSTAIEDLAGGLAESFPSWFCGGSGTVPSATYEVKIAYPPSASRDRCAQAGLSTADAEQACKESERQERLSSVHKHTGECAPDEDHAEVDLDACTARKQQARASCAPPSRGAGKTYSEYQWQERQVVVIYRKGPDAKPIEERHEKPSVLRKEKSPPRCYVASASKEAQRKAAQSQGIFDGLGRSGFDSTLDAWSPWNATANGPVCYEKHPAPPDIDFGIPVEFTEVVDIVGCVESKTNTVTPRPEDRLVQSTEDGSDKAPQKLESGLRMGDERFQIRAVAYSALRGTGSGTSTDEAERLIKLSTWGREGERRSILDSTQDAAGRFTAAQAEYYYGGHDPAAEQMWHMKWKARFRRFRISGEGLDGSTAVIGGADALSGGTFGNIIREINDLILH